MRTMRSLLTWPDAEGNGMSIRPWSGRSDIGLGLVIVVIVLRVCSIFLVFPSSLRPGCLGSYSVWSSRLPSALPFYPAFQFSGGGVTLGRPRDPSPFKSIDQCLPSWNVLPGSRPFRRIDLVRQASIAATLLVLQKYALHRLKTLVCDSYWMETRIYFHHFHLIEEHLATHCNHSNK
ncbi:hypothetical protein BKA93DRAFT_327289 [Sparassis latifolia]